MKPFNRKIGAGLVLCVLAGLALWGCSRNTAESSLAAETKRETAVESTAVTEQIVTAAEQTTEEEQTTTAEEPETTAAAETMTGDIAPAEPSSESGTEDPGYTEEDPDEFLFLLDDCAAVAPGTAGSSLRVLCAAGELLDWEEEVGNMLSADGMELLVQEWIDSRTDEQIANLKNSWGSVQSAMKDIAADPDAQRDAVADAGYTLGHESYDQEIFELVSTALENRLSIC